MSVFSVYNIKGGVGKTAAAVNLAYLSSLDGSRTLLWDLDPQSSATFYLRVKPKIKGGSRGLINDRRSIESSIKGTDFENFDLLPGAFSYRKFDRLLWDSGNPVKGMSRLLKQLAGEYDQIFLDCSPGMTVLAEALFRVSDTVLVPTIPTTLSMRTLEQLRKYYRRRSLDRSSVLGFFSMVDRRKKLHRSLCDSNTKKPFRFLKACIPFSSIVEQMGLHRNPVCFFAASSKPSRAFKDLWGEIRGIGNR